MQKARTIILSAVIMSGIFIGLEGFMIYTALLQTPYPWFASICVSLLMFILASSYLYIIMEKYSVIELSIVLSQLRKREQSLVASITDSLGTKKLSSSAQSDLDSIRVHIISLEKVLSDRSAEIAEEITNSL